MSNCLILTQVAIMGRVGGDNDAYIIRGIYALEDPNFFILNEPFTVLFANLSKLSNIPLPNFYAVLTVSLILYALAKSKNKYIFLIAYTIFIIPIGIGYLRQGLSIALMLLLLTSISRLSVFINSALSILAHPSSLIALAAHQGVDKLYNSKITYKILMIIFGVVGYIYVSESLNHYLKHYTLDNETQSTGFFYRLIFYVLILVLLSVFKNETETDKKFFTTAWLIPFACVFLYLFSGSTAADRTLIYVIPWILYGVSVNKNKICSIYISTLSVVYFFSWLITSPHAKANWQYNIFINLNLF